MAYSYQQLVGDGVTVQIPVTIGFLDRSTISVAVDNVQVTAWTWLSPSVNTIVLNTAPAVGALITIRRSTTISAIKYEYGRGSYFSTGTLDYNFKQLLYLAQEAYEATLIGGGALLDAAKAYTDSAVGYVRTYVDTQVAAMQAYVDNKTYSAAQVSANDGTSGTLFTTVAGFITKVMSSAGSGIVGYLRTATGAVASTVYAKLFEHLSVKDFGAAGTGLVDDTAAVLACVNYAKANGYSRIYFPKGIYNVNNLVLDGLSGFLIFGDGATYSLNANKGTVIRCTGTGSGIGTLLNSCSSYVVQDIWFSYTSPTFTGDVVATDNISGLDNNSGEFLRCLFGGETAAAANATNLLRIKKSYQIDTTACLFLRGYTGMGIYSYANIINIRRCQFQGITAKPIYVYTGSVESINVYMNTFEPLSNGRAGAFDMADGIFMFSMSYKSNWHGDVSSAGGGAWLRITGGRGIDIGGNTFGQSGGGVDDYAIDLGQCQGVSIVGNTCEDKLLKFSSACVGGTVSGNNVTTDVVKNKQYGTNFNYSNNFGLSSSGWRAKVYKGSNQALTTGTYTAVLFDQEYYNVGDVHSTSTNTSRLSVPVGGAGMVSVLFGATIGAANAKAFAQIRKNGSVILAQLRVPMDVVDNPIFQIAVQDQAADGDYYELYVYHNNASSINVVGGAYAASDTFGAIHKVYTGD